MKKTRRKQPTKRRRTGRNSGGATGVGIILFVFLLVMAVQIYNLKQKDNAYAAIQKERELRWEEETQRAHELDKQEEYMKITNYEFVEEQARSKLGLAYENEIIFKESEE